MTRKKLLEISRELFEGGWRQNDFESIDEEFDFDFVEVLLICEELAILETKNLG